MSERPLRPGLGLRPTEYLEIDATIESVALGLRKGLDALGPELESRWAGEHLLFSLAARRRRAWSPWLSVALRPRTGSEPGSTTLVAQFCPHPQIWTALILATIGLASLFVLALGFGWAQLILERPPWGFGFACAAMMGALALWLGSQVGKRLAREQMHELWKVLTGALPDGTGARG